MSTSGYRKQSFPHGTEVPSRFTSSCSISLILTQNADTLRPWLLPNPGQKRHWSNQNQRTQNTDRWGIDLARAQFTAASDPDLWYFVREPHRKTTTGLKQKASVLEFWTATSLPDHTAYSMLSPYFCNSCNYLVRSMIELYCVSLC